MRLALILLVGVSIIALKAAEVLILLAVSLCLELAGLVCNRPQWYARLPIDWTVEHDSILLTKDGDQ